MPIEMLLKSAAVEGYIQEKSLELVPQPVIEHEEKVASAMPVCQRRHCKSRFETLQCCDVFCTCPRPWATRSY